MGAAMPEHFILGKNEDDLIKQREMWVAGNPGVIVIWASAPSPEPRTLLVRLGGKNVPKVSMVIEYEFAEAAE
jgi:hypothetical protein